MMNNAVKNIIVRVVKNRMAAGETFKDIVKNYPKLTKEEIAEILIFLICHNWLINYLVCLVPSCRHVQIHPHI